MAKNETSKKPNLFADPAMRNMIIAGAVALVLGIGIGHLAGAKTIGGVTNLGETTFKSEQTSEVIAQYTYKGKVNAITLDDYTKSSSPVQNEDGSYQMPNAESILSLVRLRILQDVAKQEGITVTDEDVNAYLEKNFGTTDLAATAEQYGYEENQLKELLQDTIIQTKFYEKIAGTETPTQPAMPSPTEEGKENEATKEYADYIKEIAGDAWNEKANDGKGGWKDADSEYANATKDYKITNDGATYDAAQAVWNVAYSEYSTKASEYQAKVTEYTNNILKDTTITIATGIA